MDNAVLLANQVFIMFLMIGIGYVLYRLRIVGEQTSEQMTKVLFYVVVPALIIQTYQVTYTEEKGRELLLALFLSVIAMLIGIAVSYAVYLGSDTQTRDVEQFGACFSNTGFMGVPLVTAIMGTAGVFYSNTYMMVFQFSCFTFGVYIMKKCAGEKFTGRELAKLLLNPTVLCVVVGIALFFLQIRLPKTIGTTLDYLASMNTPLAMLVSGICIARINLRKTITRLRNYYVTFLKLLLIPALLIFAFRFLPGEDHIKLAILIVASCPTATNTMLFSKLYGRNVDVASSLFLLSTLFCIVSLPLVILMNSIF